jgi:uncharacterized protein YgbK (DUF1537 family)
LQARGHPSYLLDPTVESDAAMLAAAALTWYDAVVADGAAPAPLIYSSLAPDGLHRVQATLGVARSAAILEEAIGRIAYALVARGVTRVIAAGGETSGAIVTALGLSGGAIGPEAAPGVPWIICASDGISLLLKSGNFGGSDLLANAACGISETTTA